MAVDVWKDRFPTVNNRARSQVNLRLLFLEESDDLVADIAMELKHSKFWVVTHAKTGEEALKIARNDPIDVAVLSATMPQADPIDIADQLTRLHPKLTTFILAPDRESGGGLAFASGRFQWLTKPCNPAALISAVERMDALVSWMKNKSTIDLVAGIHALPTIPSNYQALLKTINDPDSSVTEVGEAISKDIGITSRILQVANSAHYGYTKRIVSPVEATKVLGLDTLKSLVLYSHVLNNFPQSQETNLEFDRIWRHSITVAGIARNIALLQTQDSVRAEEAFTAGVLHDIGKLVLMSLKPDDYKEVVRHAHETRTAIHLTERVKIKTTHAETGAYLLSLWGLPVSILEAVAWHHLPTENSQRSFSALTAVHVANVAVHRRMGGEMAALATLDERHLADVGVSENADAWLQLSPEKLSPETVAAMIAPPPSDSTAFRNRGGTASWLRGMFAKR